MWFNTERHKRKTYSKVLQEYIIEMVSLTKAIKKKRGIYEYDSSS